MAVDLSKLAFVSQVNYMKRDESSGTGILTLGGHGTVVMQTVNHQLGYIPMVHVSYEATGDGTIWSSEKIDKYTETSLGGIEPTIPQMSYWTTTTVLTIQLDNTTTPTASGTRIVYFMVYLDYGNV